MEGALEVSREMAIPVDRSMEAVHLKFKLVTKEVVADNSNSKRRNADGTRRIVGIVRQLLPSQAYYFHTVLTS